MTNKSVLGVAFIPDPALQKAKTGTDRRIPSQYPYASRTPRTMEMYSSARASARSCVGPSATTRIVG